MLLIAYQTGNGTLLAIAYLELYKYTSSREVSKEFTDRIKNISQPHIAFMEEKLSKSELLPYLKVNSVKGRFMAATDSNFSKKQTV